MAHSIGRTVGTGVISLPEDMLYETVAGDVMPLPAQNPAPDMRANWTRSPRISAKRTNPVLIVGGSAWSDAALPSWNNLPSC